MVVREVETHWEAWGRTADFRLVSWFCRSVLQGGSCAAAVLGPIPDAKCSSSSGSGGRYGPSVAGGESGYGPSVAGGWGRLGGTRGMNGGMGGA